MRCVYGAGGPPIPSPTNSATVRSNSQPSELSRQQSDQATVAALTGHVVPGLGALAIRVDDRHERPTLSARLSLGSLETAAQIVAAVMRLTAELGSGGAPSASSMVAETSSVEVTRSQRLPGGRARRCSAETESGSAQAKMAGTVMECLPATVRWHSLLEDVEAQTTGSHS